MPLIYFYKEMLFLLLSLVITCSYRYSIKGHVYPAILPLENKTVTDKFLLGITVPEAYIVVTFEDYECQSSTIETGLKSRIPTSGMKFPVAV